MRALTLSLSGFALVCTLFFSISCSSNEDDAVDPVIGPIEGIEISESTVVEGSLPASSTEEFAPSIESSTSELIIAPGGKVIIQCNMLEGDAAGFYLKVEGYNDRIFDITSVAPEINGRIKSDFPYFIIKFLENFKPGEVCVRFAVYDNTKRVSNYITRCITVKAAGGANSGFLTAHAWKATKTIEHSNEQGFDIEKLTGQTYTEETEVGVMCEGIPSNIVAEIKTRVDHRYLTLNANGTLTLDESSYSKTVDTENSECTPTYIEHTETLNSSGVWIYESDISTLTFFITNKNGSATYSYTLSQDDDDIVLRLSSAEGEYIDTYYTTK